LGFQIFNKANRGGDDQVARSEMLTLPIDCIPPRIPIFAPSAMNSSRGNCVKLDGMAKKDVKQDEQALDLSFEEAVEQVEAVIDGIENGEIGLEESIEQYERGMKLLTYCKTVLDRAEQRIAKLAADQSGKLKDAGEIKEVNRP